jgi:hypothetical protein
MTVRFPSFRVMALMKSSDRGGQFQNAHSATNRKLDSIYHQAQERFFARTTFDGFHERRAQGRRNRRGSEEPLKAGPAVRVDPDRGTIVHPGTMTCATQDRVTFFLLDDVFSDEPCTNDVCEFGGPFGADLGVDNNLRVIAQNGASMLRASPGCNLENVSGHDG